ncbi:hypothetical protein VPHK250G1_0036 [Vibrio phage K250 g1]
MLTAFKNRLIFYPVPNNNQSEKYKCLTNSKT